MYSPIVLYMSLAHHQIMSYLFAEIPCSSLGKHYNLLIDPATIRNEYYSEFKDIKTVLKWYESFQNDICYLGANPAKSNSQPEFSMLELKLACEQPLHNVFILMGFLILMYVGPVSTLLKNCFQCTSFDIYGFHRKLA